MTTAFISYSTKDEVIARNLHDALESVGAKPFMASMSIEGGAHWTREIFQALRNAEWVFFPASQESCRSPAVQQELGASLSQQKRIIPILVDIEPADLPGWVGRHQAVDARYGPEQVRQTIAKVGDEIRSQKFWGGVILGAVVVGLVATAGKDN